MFYRTLFALVATLTLTLYLYCATEEHQRADLTYVNPSGIHTLDPARMSWTQDLRIALNIYEGLTTCDPATLTPTEGAAIFPPDVSTDGLTYTFNIRDDARWSNGDQVSATDFVRGWRRCLEPGTATDYTFLLTDHVSGAKEYVEARRKGVAVLTAMSRLAGGWALEGRDAQALANHSIWSTIAKEHNLVLPEPPHTTEQWERVARSLSDSNANWGEVHDLVHAEHAAEMERIFNQVGMAATDQRTVVIKLRKPCAFFLDLTAFPTFSPCHESIELLREHHNDRPITAEGLVVYDSQWTKPDYHKSGYPGLITNGPYFLSQWKIKRRARMQVNPHYRSASDISCRTVDMVVYDDINTAMMAYEAGDLDFMPAMDVPYDHEISRLARTGERPDFHSCVLLATYFFNFNCVSKTVGGKTNPFINPDVRRAFALAIDKDAIVNKVLKRGDRIATSFVPPDAIPEYDPPSGLSYDVKEAQRLVAQAGFPGGEGLPVIELLHTPRDQWVCQAMARMWQDNLGAHVELKSKESKTFGEDKANHRFMIARGNWYADYNDPTTFLDCLVTGNGNNDSGYTNREYDDLMAQASKTTSAKERAALLCKAERLIVEDDLPILPLLHYAQPIAIAPHIRGLHPNPRMLFPFKKVSISR